MLKLFEKVSRASLQTDPREGGGFESPGFPGSGLSLVKLQPGHEGTCRLKKARIRLGLGFSKHQREKLAYVVLVLAYVGFPKALRG